MLKQDLALQIMNQTDHCPKKKVINERLMKDELGGKNMNFLKFYFGLRAKTCSYLIDDGSE